MLCEVLSIAIEQAWHEYREEHPGEEYADRLLRAIGRRGRDKREKILTHEADTGGGPATMRVRKGVKEDMKAYATEVGVPDHEILRAVVCWYISGGLLGRVTEKLERAVPEVEAQIADLDPADGNGQTAEDKKRAWLVTELTPGDFTLSEFGEALEDMPHRGGDTKHMHETHIEPVLSRAEYVEHPNQAGLYIPIEDAEEFARQEAEDQQREAECEAAKALDRQEKATATDGGEDQP